MVGTKKLFARFFFHLRNAREAAVRVGSPPDCAEAEGAALLHDKWVGEEIKKLEESDAQGTAYAKSGLTRLAFGAVNDAVRLAFDEEITSEEIMKLDLYNVSEIKRPKGGGLEIKFFDRQRALEKLVELDPQFGEESEAQRLVDAIYGRGGR